MVDEPISIQRLTDVDEELAARLDVLFDDGTVWDSAQGRLFLKNPDNLFLTAIWEGRICGFLTAHRLQRFDRRRAEVLLYEIGVHEEFRQRGIGTALIADVSLRVGRLPSGAGDGQRVRRRATRRSARA